LISVVMPDLFRHPTFLGRYGLRRVGPRHKAGVTVGILGRIRL
jgi:hypothetical protein